MRIGIDGGCWGNRRGYGRFLRELLAALSRAGGDHQYSIFLDSIAARDFPEDLRVARIIVPTSQSVDAAATAESRRSVSDLLRMSRAVAGTPLDLFFFPSVYSYFPLLNRVPMLLGVHDTMADSNPQYAFATRREQFYWDSKVRLAIFQCDAILTVSEYSRRCVAEHLRVGSKPIHVVTEGASSKFRSKPVSPPVTPFILYVGGISPSKNLDTLIKAFSRTKARQRLELWLAGDYQNDRFKSSYQALRALVQELELDSRVRFTGFVPDERLCTLYNQASLFVMPSLDEGFGLPALEAMSSGAPVVVSRGNALEEVVGDAGLVVDPHDQTALAEAMDGIVADSGYAAELGRGSLRRAAGFSWDASARRFLDVVEHMRRRGGE